MKKKKVVTDILIEEYQKEFDESFKYHIGKPEAKELIAIQARIDRLQSMRQQEVQNVVDGYDIAKRNVLTHNVLALQSGNDYFTQTFEQKGGEKK